MTVPANIERNDYIGNGSTEIYAYGYKVSSEDHHLVTVADLDGAETTLVKTTDYTVTGVGVKTGGNIVLVDNSQDWIDESGYLKTGYRMSIRHYVPLTQSTDIRNQGVFYPETHEDAFDYLMWCIKQQQDELDRCLKSGETDTDPFTVEDLNAIVSESQAAQDAAETAQGLAEAAQTAAEAAQGLAETAKTAAELAETHAETAEANAETAQAAAEAARDLAQNYAAALIGTSTSSVAIGTGSKTFTTQASKQWVVGDFVIIANTADPSNYMFGQVTSYSSTTLIVNVLAVGGSGTLASWNISVSGIQGAKGDQGDQGIQGEQGEQGEAGGVVSIVAGANITVDNTDPANPIVASTATGGGSGEFETYEATAGAGATYMDISGTIPTDLDNVEFYIDGVKQAKSSLTRTSDTRLTFGAALVGGELLELRILVGVVEADKASQAEAEAGTADDVYMTPLKVKQELVAVGGAADIAAADSVIFTDATDGALKRDTVQGILDLTGFVARNPTTFDFTTASFTKDGTYRNFDLSGIVPAGAKAVLLAGRINCSTSSSGSATGILRKDGTVVSEAYLYPVVASSGQGFAVIVNLPSTRIIQYYFSNHTWNNIDIAIHGWWI